MANTIFYVDNNADTASDTSTGGSITTSEGTFPAGTLREAINYSNESGQEVTIDFQISSTGGGGSADTINLKGPLPPSQYSITINPTNQVDDTPITINGTSGFTANRPATDTTDSGIQFGANGELNATNAASTTDPDPYQGNAIFNGNQGTGATSVGTGTGSSVTGSANGIVLVQSNATDTNAATVTVAGNVTGQGGTSAVPAAYQALFTDAGLGDAAPTGYGVLAVGAGAGQVEVDQTAGTIQARADGIDALSTGSGALVVDATGGQIGTSATAVGGAGISASRTTAGDITVTGNAIHATNTGIVAENNSSGAGDVTVDAEASIDSSSARAIFASTDGTGNVAVTTAPNTTLSSEVDLAAIRAQHTGTGTGYVQVDNNATLDRNNDVDDNVSIFAVNNYDPNSGVTPGVASAGSLFDNVLTAITIGNTGSITDQYASGVLADADSAGAVSVDNSGSIATGGGYGVDAENLGAGTGAVSVGGIGSISAADGIIAYQEGVAAGAANAGIAVTVSGTGTTTGTDGVGIDAEVTQTTNNGDVLVTRSGDVQAATVGIDAETAGSGTVTVTTGAGTVTGNSGGGTTAANVGIDAASTDTGASGAVAVTTGAGAVSGVSGITASSSGTGTGSTVTVAVNGDVTGTGNSGAGVSATGVAGTVEVDQAAGIIASGHDGIDVTTAGTGALVVDATGGQIGTGQASVGNVGIDAARQTAGDITVTGQTIYSTSDGIDAENTGGGTGNVSVTAQGSITASDDSAIVAVDQGAGDIVIGTAANTTLSSGNARNAAIFGQLSGTATGYVQVTNAATLTRPTGTSGDTGINVLSSGAAMLDGVPTAVSVTNSGAITDNFSLVGIYARASSAGVISVTNAATGSIGGGFYGIAAIASGTGGVTVANAGTIAGAAGSGILAESDGTAGGVAVTNANAIGSAGAAVSYSGIDATITGASNAGNVSVDGAGAIYAAGDGIDADTAGTGGVTLGGATALGAITTTDGSGIVAAATSGPVAVTTGGAISAGGAGNAGISVTGDSAANTVTANAAVGGAIGLEMAGTGTTTLTNNSAIASTATGGNALQIDGGTLVIGDAPGTLTGDIAIVNGAATMNGADGPSVLDLDYTNAAPLALANSFTGAGTLNSQGSGLVSLTGTNSAANGQFTGTVDVDAGVLAFNGTFGDTANLQAATVNVGGTGTLHGSGTIDATVDVNGGGTISAGNSPGVLNTGNLNLASGSTFLEEIAGTTPAASSTAGYDQVDVTGAVNLGGATLDLSFLGGFTSTTGDVYTLIANDGTDAVQGEFSFGGTALAQGATFTDDGRVFQISYTANTDGSGGTGTAGNDVTITDVTPGPVLSGLQPVTTALQDAMRPFGSATVTDMAPGATDSITIAPSGAAGTLAGAGLVANANGTYTLGFASPQTLTQELDALTFAPAITDGGPVEAATFQLTDTSTSGASSSASTAYTVNSIPNQGDFGTTTTSATSPQGEVYALYQGLLARAPDPVGGETAVADLQNGASLDQLTQSLLVSSEGSSWFTPNSSNGDFVNQLYERVLGRVDSYGEQAYWDQTLANGASRAQVADDFVFSQEHLNDIQPALSQGVFVADAATSDTARLYYGLLDRSPDASGLAANTGQLDATMSLTGLAQSFLNSSEYAADNPVPPSNQAFVNALFENALGRSPDPGGYWVQQLDSGAETRAQVTVGIVESAEAQQHLAARIETGFHIA